MPKPGPRMRRVGNNPIGAERVAVISGAPQSRPAPFSPDGHLLASASDDETVWAWDPATGNQLRTLTGHTGPVVGVAFSPDGRLLATASDDKTVRLWN